MLDAKEAFLEGRSYLLDHRFQEASGEFEQVVQHLDQARELDPNGPLAQKIETVKRKFQEAQESLSEGHDLPPYLLDDLRQEFQAVLP